MTNIRHRDPYRSKYTQLPSLQMGHIRNQSLPFCVNSRGNLFRGDENPTIVYLKLAGIGGGGCIFAYISLTDVERAAA